MSRYTPGPWQSDCAANITAQTGQISIGCAYNIAWPCGFVPEDYLANARLIAAAPDLLEALQYARRFMRKDLHDTDYIDGVIAKATGEINEP